MENEQKLADFEEELKLGRRHQQWVSFLVLGFLSEGKRQSHHGVGQLKLTQILNLSGLKNQNTLSESTTAITT